MPSRLFANGPSKPRYVTDFRHEQQVDEIEVAKPTNVPTIRTIMICHSMGGIVAVDSLLAMIDEKDPLRDYIMGILAYDTPYFGLNPPVIHRTITNRVNTVASAVKTAREWIPQNLFSKKSGQVTTISTQKSSWSFGTLAAVGAGVAAVGALSYFSKDRIVDHLQFVSVLYKPDELARRMRRLYDVPNVGFATFYTVVTAPCDDERERTFCNLPEDMGEGRWIRQENGLAKDEVEAHCGIFLRTNNDHYDEMCTESLRIIRNWISDRR